MHQYEITGRRKPDAKNPTPKVYRMKIFAPNTVVARSRFWYYLSKLKKVKRANGEIAEIHEIFEKNPNTVKTFGLWLRYDSRSGTHNMYKEYRDVTLNAAVLKMYADLASRHRARKSAVQIIRTAIVAGKEAKRPATLQFLDSKIKFRLLHRVPHPSSISHRKRFKATVPVTFF